MKETNDMFERFVSAGPNPDPELQEEIRQGGYTAFNSLLEGFRRKLMESDEKGMEELEGLLEAARKLIPDPGAISPSWERIWSDYDAYIKYKREALQAVCAEQRDGEWQIVMDNPFTNEGIACYPALSFVEAAYLYGYFRKDLKKNEYIRLQKVVSLLKTEGD